MFNQPGLEVVPGSVATIVNATSPGSAGVEYGYEDGSVVRVGNVTHMLVSEMIAPPYTVKMRLAHWTTSKLSGGSGWSRIGTLMVDGIPMISTANCSSSDHLAAMWSPVAFFEGGTWYMHYVGYDCGPRPNVNGDIKLTRSVQPGLTGIGGPYTSVGVLLQQGAASQAWEGLQGVDSFFAFKASVGKAGGLGGGGHDSSGGLLAFYGSSPWGWPWNVGLAHSLSGSIEGPWERLASGNPLNLSQGHTENPIVLATSRPHDGMRVLLMFHDYVLQNAIGFGFSWSLDGRNWSSSVKVSVPGGCEAPLAVLPSLVEEGGLTVWYSKRGSFSRLYAAQLRLTWQ
jgi:hypothetical protein